MDDTHDRKDAFLQSLQERAKELQSLYAIEKILKVPGKPLDEIFEEVVAIIPSGWQYPPHCQAKISFRDRVFESPGFRQTSWIQSTPIVVEGRKVGSVGVYYTHQMPLADEGPFLKEERKLLETIADRLGQTILRRETQPLEKPGQAEFPLSDEGRGDWRIILKLLERTNLSLYMQISRKMLNHLSCAGIEEAKELLGKLSAGQAPEEDLNEDNSPLKKNVIDMKSMTRETFRIAAGHFGEEEILGLIQLWVKEDRVNFLVQALESPDTSLCEIASAMERYQNLGINARELSMATQVGLKTNLVRRLLTDHMDIVGTSRKFLEVEDFINPLTHTVLVPKSHGKLGGKSSGLFLASHIIRRSREFSKVLSRIRIPKTWYVPSDTLLEFLAYNSLDDVYSWKYRDIDQIRQEYPHILQVFKTSRFPPDTLLGLSHALNSFGNHPLIVRSSSLLEDQMGAAFSGKYKSLFLANQGEKSSRLAALVDALAEVYASVFSPDPIQYRAERGLLDEHEEMGIMIQEVVGTHVGRYFFPAFSGVGFSNNEFRWSPRIKREDGLLRIVPGLGTRAVDRLTDDYPVLVAPGQPNLRVNVSPEEAVRYSPKKIDVIDLEKNVFKTMEVRTLLNKIGSQYPGFAQLVSIFEDGRIRPPSALDSNVPSDSLLFTFEGLISRTPFMATMKSLLTVLKETLRTPVDIEFASTGTDIYLLQCRPQCYSQESSPDPIPRDLPSSQILFSAHKYVSNGKLPEITHIVYVDPEGYSRLSNLAQYHRISRAVGDLNKILPKRRFILMGPGRWGSRGDIKLGVSVTYSDISNTAMLVEIARKHGNYLPDLSFGTHFFQDLVESSIRYLPLYPDDPGAIFQEDFLRNAPNILGNLLPDYASLGNALRVIDVPRSTGGRILRVLMNADLDEALGILASPGDTEEMLSLRSEPASRPNEDHSRWRLHVAEKIAAELDSNKFGVKNLYLFGSTRNNTAEAVADIDLIVHYNGDPVRKQELELWFDGWSRCLSEMNYLRTGYGVEKFLDIRYVTDEDVAHRRGIAMKINAITDPARPLALAR